MTDDLPMTNEGTHATLPTMSAPTIFISAATIDLEPWRDVLHDAFSRAGFRVYTQKHSLGAATGDVHRLLTQHLRESQCVIHLAGMGYGADADLLDPAMPGFQCSWIQFEYYYAHQQGIDVIAFVCAPDLSEKFAEAGKDAADIARKTKLQLEHRDRVSTGKFEGTPLAGKVKRTSNEQVDSVQTLMKAVAGAVGTLHKFGTAGQAVQQALSLRGSLHQLPPNPRLSGFVGRTKDLEILRQQPTTGTVLTGLRGMGGIGKTALGLVLAYEWTAQFPDAQFWLDGQGTQARPTTPESLLAKVIQTYHPTAQLPAELPALQEIYHQVLSGQRVLIVLDNAKDAAQAKPLIPPAGCGFIVTSRNNILLGTKGAYSVDRLPDEDAAALLREYHPELTDAHAAALSKLCAGLPLALRLAGAHLALDASEQHSGVPDVAGYLQKLQSSRLGTLDADAPDANEITISETLRLSEDQLPPAEQTAWRSLGVFTSSFDAPAAQAIAGADETTLAHLVRRSLLDRDGTDRYKLHDLAAEYAQGKLPSADLDALRLSHAQHFTAVGDEADNLYMDGNAIAGLALFDREREQIEAAYAWLDRQPGETAARQMIALVGSITYTSELRFHPRQRITWLESQLRAARVAKHRGAEGSALGNLGNAHLNLGDARKAIEFYEQQLVITREIGDRRGEGNALGSLGNAYADLGDARKAIEYHDQQLVITREIGDRRGEGNALWNSALAYKALGNLPEAIARATAALAIYEAIEDPFAPQVRAKLATWQA